MRACPKGCPGGDEVMMVVRVESMKKTMLFCLWPVLQLELGFCCEEWLHWDTFWSCLWTPTLLEVWCLYQSSYTHVLFKTPSGPRCPASKRWAWATGTAGRTELMGSTCAEQYIKEEIRLWQRKFSNTSNSDSDSQWGHAVGRLSKSCCENQVCEEPLATLGEQGDATSFSFQTKPKLPLN